MMCSAHFNNSVSQRFQCSDS